MPEHVSGNSQNNTPVKEVRKHSTFDLSRYIFGTHRFGQYNINFYGETVGDDSIPVRSSDVIDSYTLKAPLMQDISKTKEYFMVPRQAILPINWDKIERLPALGDDVDASLVNSTFTNFEIYIGSLCSLYSNYSSSDYAEPSFAFDSFIKRLLFLEYFFSNGSLLSATGCHLSSLIAFTPSSYISGSYISFDRFFDIAISSIVETISNFEGDSIYLTFDNISYPILGEHGISFHRVLELCRDNFNFSFTGSEIILEQIVSSSIDSLVSTYSIVDVGNQTDEGVSNVNFSIDRCASYQLVCSHFFSNDSVDYIYSADLWRQNMRSLAYSFISDDIGHWPYFTYNGVKTDYDVLSASVMKLILSDAIDWFDSTGKINSVNYWINLLSWRRSLRFQDYFTGAKTRPLAPGDFSVAVDNNKVDVVNITKNIAFQRLANNVNRIGNRIEDWLEKIIGVGKVQPDYHNPMWLASTRSTIYAVKSENSNNASVENLPNITTSANFNGRDSEYEFTIHADRSCVIIGITYYDIRRAYSDGIDRMLSHVDRFDGFIPDMQFIGDQDIKGQELSVLASDVPISYTLRNMEYKQVHDEAYGGFVENLPGFAFLYGYERVFNSFGDLLNLNFQISPEFIRSRGDEFDKFYTSLTGYSNASYFHFIVKTYNEVNANRPMVYAPQIL